MKKEDLKKIVYQSWQNGNEWSDEELHFILRHNCTCDECEKTVNDFDDFPEIDIENNEFLCEQCYDYQYRVSCPICENSYDVKDGQSEYYVKTEEDAEYEKAGIYHLGNLIVPIKINELKKIDCGPNCCDVYSHDICSDCVSDLVRKDNFIKSHGSGIPCILIKKYENDSMFSDWSIERFKRTRIKLIHARITIRGIIETANK